MKFLDELGLHYLMGKLNGKFNLKADKTYVDSRVKTAVPADARFTDTVYSHPATHPASIIVETAAKRFVTDTEKGVWSAKADKTYVDEKVKTDVPAGAVFTDTKYTHPSTHPYSMITGTPTSLPANGGSADTSKHLIGDDTRNNNLPPSEYMNGGSRFEGRAGWQTEFKRTATIGVHSFLSGTYCYLETRTPWSDPSGGYPIQIAYGNGYPVWRIGTSLTAWSEWRPYVETVKTVTSATEPSNLNTGDQWYREI